MLPSQLLRARRLRDRLTLRWATGGEEELALAGELISQFRPGRSLAEVHSAVEEIEEAYGAAGIDFKLVRGLALILERRCSFERPETRVSPERARLAVYRVVNRRFHGFASGAQREEALRLAADELGVTVEELEEALWADSDEALRLSEADLPDPEGLLREYNLSLLQTALFRSVRLAVETRSPGWQVKRLLRAVKALGLMYTASRVGGALRLDVDGPATVLKMTTRYGTALARLVPRVVSMDDWRMFAWVVRRSGSGEGRLSLRLEVDSSDRNLFPALQEPGWEVEYDSSLERDFAIACSLDGWRVEREPEPLLAGRSVLIPDFLIRKGPVRVYVEVMGFWTPQYIRRKLEKLKEVERPVLVVVKRDLACAPVEEVARDVLYFEGRGDVKPLLERLREIEERGWNRVVSSEGLSGRLRPEGDLVSLRDLAEGHGLTPEQALEVADLRGYRVVGDHLISENLLSRAAEILLSRRPGTVGQARAALEEIGVAGDLAAPVIEAVGLKVRWRSLEEDDAEVVYPP